MPLAGRMSLIFTPRSFTVVSCLVLSTGLFITAVAKNLPVFLLGRVLSGCGSGGMMNVSFILVLELAKRKQRGLLFGFINGVYTVGVASGAVFAGLITPVFGWVCDHNTFSI